MRPFNKVSIKYQLVIIIVLITLFSLGIASTAFISYDRHVYKEHMAHDATILSRVASSHFGGYIEKGDYQTVQANLESLMVDNEILSACITNLKGELIAQYRKSVLDNVDNDLLCLGKQGFITRFEVTYFDHIQPVLFNNSKKVGEIHIRMSLEALNKRFAVFSVVMILIVFLVSVVAAILSSRIQSIISTPLLTLTTSVDRIRTNQDYSVRLDHDRQDEIGKLMDSFNELLITIEEKSSALLDAKDNLEYEVEDRTNTLKIINRELEAFTYSVSHDLKAPLRSVDGFSKALLEDYGDKLDPLAVDYLKRIKAASENMAELIESLLYLSKVTRQDLQTRVVDFTKLCREVVDEIRLHYTTSDIEFSVADNMVCYGDYSLLTVVVHNIVANACKYSINAVQPKIEIGSTERNNEQVFFIRDNGVGFDMKYIDKLFAPFQRLHAQDEYEGMGIGLATVARIIHRHNGEIWAESIVGSGATFYFTLGTHHA